MGYGCYGCVIGNLVELESLILHGNDINGPAPISLKELVNLKDFTLFSCYSSESFQPKRRFSRTEFERVYVNGPKLKLDNVHWDNEVLYGDTPPTPTATAAGLSRHHTSKSTYKSAIEPVAFRTAHKYDIHKTVKGVDIESYENYDPRFRLKLLSEARKERYTMKDG